MNHEKAAKMTESELLDSMLADGTYKTYESNIKLFIKSMTDEEKEEHVDSSNRLKKSLPKDLLSKLLRNSQVKTVDGKIMVKSFSSFGTATSSMKFWHSNSDRHNTADTSLRLDDEKIDLLKDLSKARKRVWAGLKASGEVSSLEGKLPVTFETYRNLAKLALSASNSGNEAIMAHSFVTLCWNLVARASIISDLLWNNIGWNGDCLTVLYEKGKCNQDGSKKVPRHVFANPDDPIICPILALGLKLCCESYVSKETIRVFSSNAPEKAFSRWISNRVDGLKEDQDTDVLIDDFSTHSLRKGAATYVVGLVDGPDSDIVKLRMEHTLGRSDDKYIYREAGGDKYVGRAVAGLDLNDMKFSALPPHFKTINFNVDEVIPERTLVSAAQSLKAAFPFLVASVIYHWDWLLANLPKTHPFFGSKIYFDGYIEHWKELVVSGYFINEESGLRASGVPRYIKTIAELKNVVTAVRENPKETAMLVLDGISSAHNVQIHNSKSIRDTIDPVVAPITAQLNKIEGALLSFMSPQKNHSQAIAVVSNTPYEYRRFKWGGRYHDFPQSFKLPQLTSSQMWHLWLFGDSNKVNTPHYLLKGEYMGTADRIQLSKTRTVMDAVRHKIDLSYEEIIGFGRIEAEKLFNKAYLELLGDKRYHGSMKCTNAYKHLLKNKK